MSNFFVQQKTVWPGNAAGPRDTFFQPGMAKQIQAAHENKIRTLGFDAGQIAKNSTSSKENRKFWNPQNFPFSSRPIVRNRISSFFLARMAAKNTKFTRKYKKDQDLVDLYFKYFLPQCDFWPPVHETVVITAPFYRYFGAFPWNSITNPETHLILMIFSRIWWNQLNPCKFR